MTRLNLKIPNPLGHVSLETGDVIALTALAFFVGMIVEKVWNNPVCWWPI